MAAFSTVKVAILLRSGHSMTLEMTIQDAVLTAVFAQALSETTGVVLTVAGNVIHRWERGAA
jgi:hypothetical protein